MRSPVFSRRSGAGAAASLLQKRCPHDMKTRLIDEPGFAAETSAFLEQIGQAAPISDYESLLAARARTASPAVSGQMDPAVQAADLYLPARGGPVLARLYRERGARGPRQILLWLHGGGFIGGSVVYLGAGRFGVPRLCGGLVGPVR